MLYSFFLTAEVPPTTCTHRRMPHHEHVAISVFFGATRARARERERERDLAVAQRCRLAEGRRKRTRTRQ